MLLDSTGGIVLKQSSKDAIGSIFSRPLSAKMVKRKLGSVQLVVVYTKALKLKKGCK